MIGSCRVVDGLSHSNCVASLPPPCACTGALPAWRALLSLALQSGKEQMNLRRSAGGGGGGLSPATMNASTMDDTALASGAPGAERPATCREPVCATHTQRYRQKRLQKLKGRQKGGGACSSQVRLI